MNNERLLELLQLAIEDATYVEEDSDESYYYRIDKKALIDRFKLLLEKEGS